MKSAFTSLLISAILIMIPSCSNNKQTVELYPDLTTYNVGDELQFDPSWFDADKKLIVASKSLFMFSLPFMDIIEPYDLPVLIYISVEDKDEIITYLQKHDFKYPFIHDPKGEFFKGNNILERMKMDPENTVVSIFVESNKITERAEIGMRHLLKEQVEEFTNK
jgi:hypothetical protein